MGKTKPAPSSHERKILKRLLWLKTPDGQRTALDPEDATRLAHTIHQYGDRDSRVHKMARALGIDPRRLPKRG